MKNKERDKTTEFSPLIFMANFLEIIAVVLFLVMVIEFSQQSSDNQLALINVIGFLVLFAWLLRKIDKLVQIPLDALDTLLDRLLRLLTNVAPAGSSTYKPIEPKKLCGWHKYSFWMAFGVFMLVMFSALVILTMFSLAEGSPVTSTVWEWTKLCAISLMAISGVWIMGTLFHARRRCASNVDDGLDKSKI